MKKIVIMPGGFHPFHAGHAALYQSAVKAFPDAEVYVAASNDTSERPFPFAIKEKLARVAGVPPGHFVQVKSPFTSEEITSKYDPNSTVLIFVKSEKNSKNGSDPEGPFPAEVDPTTGKLPVVTRGPRKGQPVSNRLQYYKGNEKNLQPMSQHSYLAYLPTVKFGPGITSASEIRASWPKLNDKRKTAMVMSLYPETQKNPKLAANVVKMLDMSMGGQQGVAEGLNEMDKSAPQPGRDGKVSHSTYGSRDKKGSDYFKGKEAPGKPITKKQMEKHALDILKKQGVAEGNYDRDDYYNAHRGSEYGRDLTATGYGGDGSKTRRDDIFKGQSKRLPADPFARTSGAVPTAGTGRIHSTAQPDEMDEGDISQLEKDVADAPVAPIANMEGAKEKIGGRHDPADFDDMVNRLKKLAGAGPMKTVYDPNTRRYKNMPTAVQPRDKK